MALASSLEETLEPAAHLEKLIPLAESTKTALQQIANAGGQVFWSCFVTAKPTGNMIWLEPGILSRLANLGLPLVFDIYNSDSDE
jgi:hypothetical protein